MSRKLIVHQRATVGGRTFRIERAENRPYSLSTGSLRDVLEIGKPLNLATSSAILKELIRTVSRFRGLHDPWAIACALDRWAAYTYLSDGSHKILEPTRLCR
jgi:hypothetical protein